LRGIPGSATNPGYFSNWGLFAKKTCGGFGKAV
jgi:hypothetical protein